MKKNIIRTLLLAFTLLTSQAFAAPITYTFHPFDSSGQCWDINDLDHYKYYAWQISNFSLAQNQKIVGASLTFTNIYNWTNESTDKLYIHLLNTAPTTGLSNIRSKTRIDADLGSGTKYYNTKLLQGTDNQGGGDNFVNMGTLISPTWSDPDDTKTKNDVVYDFAHLGGSIAANGNIVNGSLSILSILEQYLRDGNNFAFGIDPDCHYYNEKVTFTITTDVAPVPEPGTMMLLGVGMLGLAIFGKRRLNKDS